MKKIFAAVLLIAAVVVSAADASVLKYAENTSVAAAEINVRKLLANSGIEQLLNEPETLKQRAELEKANGVRLQDFKSIFILINSTGEAIVLLNVEKSFNIEQVFTKNKIKYQVKKIAGKNVFVLSDPLKTGKQVELLSLEPGMILAGESGSIARYLSTKRGTPAKLAEIVKKTPAAPVWLAFANLFKEINDPRELYLTFKFAGKEKRDLSFKLALFCNDTQGAQILSAQAPLFLTMGLAFVFGNDPQLNKEIGSCLKIAIQDSKVLIDFYIEEQLVKKISAFFEQNAGRLLQQGMDAVGVQPASQSAPAVQNKTR